ncbi:MAG TPA: PD-(D/E)XK nuclease family protein, partial [Limnochordia bacterium]|nr:PD-(D/E)XK nuclease family protein [Limnochordia bacterium]
RRYYYQYYGKHDAEHPRAQIERLKGLTTVPMAIGTLTHEVIAAILARLLKSVQPLDRARLAAYVQRSVHEALAHFEFDEVYYQLLAEVGRDAILPRVSDHVAAFVSGERFKWILQRAVHHVDSWMIEPPGYGETRIDGQKAYCKVDFACFADGRYWVFDWKTGREDEARHQEQLAVYAAWVAEHYGVPPEQVTPVVAYFQPTYSERRIEVSAAELGRLSAKVHEEVAAMHAFCRDPANNLPLPKAEFALTDDLRCCRRCGFRELCGRAAAPAAQVG